MLLKSEILARDFPRSDLYQALGQTRFPLHRQRFQLHQLSNFTNNNQQPTLQRQYTQGQPDLTSAPKQKSHRCFCRAKSQNPKSQGPRKV